MWREYSISFIRKNRASSISIMVAALISAMLLSLLCSVFYNMWVYDVESVKAEDGDWHGRIIGAVSEEELSLIRNFANVDRVVAHETGEHKTPDIGQTSAEHLPEETASENRESAELSAQLSAAVDLYFHNPRTIYEDMTTLSENLGLEEERIAYNYQLLSLYLIRIPGDEKPRMMFPLYLAIILIVCISLVLVIHNSFAVSMNARIHQLGILSGIGATPKQIRSCLLQEAVALCILPIIGGCLVGIGMGFGMIRMMSSLAGRMTGRHEVTFQYHILIFVLTIIVTMLTVLFSAWIPARKLAKLTPLEAIRGVEEIQLRRKKHSPILFLLFGIEGELAGNALKAQKKALRTSALSLTLSFLGFTLMLCVFKLSGISTEYTYFARYQDVWDVMATVKNVRIEDFSQIAELQSAEKALGASGCTVYQKGEAVAWIPESEMSSELKALGGVEAVAGTSVRMADAGTYDQSGTDQVKYDNSKMDEDAQGQSVPDQNIFCEAAGDAPTEETVREEMTKDGAWKRTTADGTASDRIYLVKAPIVILDDESFMEYCHQIGISPSLDGAVIINRIWDSLNSNFRYRRYLPYVQENTDSTLLQNSTQINEPDESLTEIPVLGFTQTTPVLKEEYDDYALVHVLPLSLWRTYVQQIGAPADEKQDVYIRILMDREKADVGSGQNVTESRLTEHSRSTADENAALLVSLIPIEESLAQLVGTEYETEIDNRVQDKLTNDRLILGYKIVIGIFCALLAVIGIANIFSYTMGFLRQRRREFARYLSVGMTPDGLKKMFRIEILVIAGRPILITLPVTVLAISLMIRASYLNPAEFWTQAPYVPIAVFIAAIFAFVTIAYVIGGRRILRDSLAEALRNDALG